MSRRRSGRSPCWTCGPARCAPKSAVLRTMASSCAGRAISRVAMPPPTRARCARCCVVRRGAHRDALLLGAALALEIVGRVSDPREGVRHRERGHRQRRRAQDCSMPSRPSVRGVPHERCGRFSRRHGGVVSAHVRCCAGHAARARAAGAYRRSATRAATSRTQQLRSHRRGEAALAGRTGSSRPPTTKTSPREWRHTPGRRRGGVGAHRAQPLRRLAGGPGDRLRARSRSLRRARHAQGFPGRLRIRCSRDAPRAPAACSPSCACCRAASSSSSSTPRWSSACSCCSKPSTRADIELAHALVAARVQRITTCCSSA